MKKARGDIIDVEDIVKADHNQVAQENDEVRDLSIHSAERVSKLSKSRAAHSL